MIMTTEDAQARSSRPGQHLQLQECDPDRTPLLRTVLNRTVDCRVRFPRLVAQPLATFESSDEHVRQKLRHIVCLRPKEIIQLDE